VRNLNRARVAHARLSLGPFPVGPGDCDRPFEIGPGDWERPCGSGPGEFDLLSLVGLTVIKPPVLALNGVGGLLTYILEFP